MSDDRELKTAGGPPPGSPITWPFPPTLQAGPEGEQAPVEACELVLAGGARMAGELTRFDPAAGRLAFRRDAADEERIIALSGVARLRLTREVKVRRHGHPLEQRGKAIHPASEAQAFTIELHGGETFTGETAGHVLTSAGLFVFLPAEPDAVVRCFFPREAIRGRTIGLPIGETLARANALDREGLDAAVGRQRTLRGQRLGDYLTEDRIVTREQLALALKHQEGKPLLRIGEALVQLGLISAEQLESALARQRRDRGKPLGRILREMGLVEEGELREALARKLGIPFVGLRDFDFDAGAIAKVGAGIARRRQLVPLFLHEGAIVVAFEDPLDVEAIEDVRFATQCRVIPAMASGEEIRQAIAAQYGAYRSIARPAETMEFERDDYRLHRVANVDVEKLAASLRIEDQALAVVGDSEEASDSALVQLVNKMVLDAWTSGVSDIHVESNPGRSSTHVRFRKDGTLLDYLEVPAGSRNALVSRLKIMAKLDISERRRPQDGRIAFREFGPADVELRVATIPTSGGLEDVVMRVLAGTRPVPVDQLGLSAAVLDSVRSAMDKPLGLVLVCGPTGSGKTTTLHSLLGLINVRGRKIWTAEDPIEIVQPGLRQVQVNPKIGWTFAAALRSFLRADPDVVMVGEMRDAETARAGIEASLTGHLVLSTLHTNSAPESIVRLLDLGLDPFNFADALLVVLSQRLARAFCPHCRKPRSAAPGELEALAAEYCEGTDERPGDILRRWSADGTGSRLHEAPGCPECGSTGYLGRTGIHELLVMSPALRHLVQTRAPVGEVARIARAEGMRTLKQDGIEKVLAGLTDIGRVRAICA